MVMRAALTEGQAETESFNISSGILDDTARTVAERTQVEQA